jgi:hypothetical protein
MADYNNAPRNFTRKKTALDNFNFSISVPVENEQGKRSKLYFTLSGNNLTIKVYTGVTADQGNQNGLIAAKLEGINFYTFLEMVMEAVKAPGEYKSKIEYSNYTFPGGKRSEQMSTISTVYVGKNAEGLVWLSIIDNIHKERPRIQFPFGAGRSYNYKHGDGSDYTKAEVSQLFAKAFYHALYEIGAHLMTTEYVEPPKKERGGYGRSNNDQGARNYNNNSGNNNSAGDLEGDDIPF